MRISTVSHGITANTHIGHKYLTELERNPMNALEIEITMKECIGRIGTFKTIVLKDSKSKHFPRLCKSLQVLIEEYRSTIIEILNYVRANMALARNHQTTLKLLKIIGDLPNVGAHISSDLAQWWIQ